MAPLYDDNYIHIQYNTILKNTNLYYIPIFRESSWYPMKNLNDLVQTQVISSQIPILSTNARQVNSDVQIESPGVYKL